MYNEYPDLIYEGLLHDFEYVNESSNKQGMMTKIKIFIKKLVDRIILFFKRMKNKLTGKKDEYQSKSRGENESVGDYLKRTDKKTTVVMTKYNFNQVEQFITSDCEKTLNELLKKYSDLIYWMMIQYDKKNYNLYTEYHDEESEFREYTKYCSKKIENIITNHEIQKVTEELYNNAFKMLKIMNNNHIDIVCNETLIKLDKIDKEIERKEEKEKSRTKDFTVYQQALSAMGGISYAAASVVRDYVSGINDMINDFNKIISVVDITKSPYDHDRDEA